MGKKECISRLNSETKSWQRKFWFLHCPAFHVLVIFVVGLLVYSNTLDNPFQWDDNYFIKQNPIVKDLSYFGRPSKAEGLEFYDALKSRYVGYLTFALNYRLHGFDVFGYHLFNLTVHILNAALFYYLIVLAFRTPFLSDCRLKEHSRDIAFFSSLLFVSHPVQTEAVTYIFQRLASLAALFYLMAVVFYIRFRLSERTSSWILFYALSLCSAVLAMKTKENAFTLPVMLALFEFLFFSGSVKRRLLELSPFMLMVIIVPLTFAGTEKTLGEFLAGMESSSRGYSEITRKDYLLTEFRVVADYLRLLFLPVGQSLVHEYELKTTVFDMEVILPFLFFLFLTGVALFFYHRSRYKTPATRLVAFGIFWFFIAVSVESSIIPIPMVMTEYRLYLPSVGFFISVMTGVFIFLGKLKSRLYRRAIVASVILVSVFLSYGTYERNIKWQNRTTLWDDAVKKSSGVAVAHNNLGVAYASQGRFGLAAQHYKDALALKPDFVEARFNLGVAYAAKGMTDKAEEQYLSALTLNPSYSLALYNLGMIYENKGQTEKAVKRYEEAVDASPDNVKARNSLGIIYAKRGMPEDAIKQFEAALSFKPDDKEDLSKTHYNLGLAYSSVGAADKAVEHFNAALKIDPENVKALNNLAVMYASRGLVDLAIKHFAEVVRLTPDNADARYNLAVAYLQKDRKYAAKKELEELLTINPDNSRAKRLLQKIK